MATLIQTNTFIGGMNRDSGNHIIDPKLYRYAENISVLADKNDEFGYISSRDHIYKYNDVLPKTDLVLGSVLTKITIDNTTNDCLIVITKSYNTNKIYRIIGLTTGILLLVDNGPYIDYNLDINNECTVFANVESKELSKIYICDGVHQLRIIDVNSKEPLLVQDSSQFDSVPEISINAPVFQSYTSGSLVASKVQYFIKVFHKNGTSSSLSLGSNLIPIAKSPSAADSTGLDKGENSNNGVILTVDLSNINKYFNYILIYRVLYLDDFSQPTISIIGENKYSKGNVIITDTGNSEVTQVSVDEFIALMLNNIHYPKIIQPHGTRMFSGNITEQSFDIPEEYDTRAYRCNDAGVVKLDSVSSKSINTSIDNILTGTVNIDKEHDCINPSNVKIGQSDGLTYVYGKLNDKLFLGGSGPNVSYKFVYTEIVPANINSNGGALNNSSAVLYDNNTKATSNVYAKYGDGTLSRHRIFNASRIPNYSDPLVCANGLGYKRDEVYSFGVVFYNKNGVKSPVHWIADIKMPSCSYKYATNDTQFLYPFKSGYYSSNYNRDVELVGYVLGVEFTFDNLPKDVVRYEIVRCDRSASNRSIVSQGVLSNIWGVSDIFGTESNTWCMPSPWLFTAKMYGDSDYYYEEHSTLTNSYVRLNRVNNTYEYVSPESCFSDNSNDLLRDKIIKPIRYIASNNGVNTLGFILAGTPEQLDYPSAMGYKVDYGNALCTKRNDFCIPNYIADKGLVSTMKYFYDTSNNISNISNPFTIDDCIAGRIDIDGLDLLEAESYKQFVQNIKEWDYINLVKRGRFNKTFNSHWAFAAHGKNNIVRLTDNLNLEEDIYNLIDYPVTRDLNTTYGKANTIPVCNVYDTNVIQYNGNSYSARTNRTYISTGCSSTDDKCCCYGGDTYLTVLDHLTSSMEYIYGGEWLHNDEDRTVTCVNSLIPLESTYNIDLRNDLSLSKKIVDSGLNKNFMISNLASVRYHYVLDTSLYQYNSVYSADATIPVYTPNSLYTTNTKTFTNRVLSSEPKTNNEIIDSWSLYKYADYIDIDYNHGLLTNLKSFFNKLYYFTETSVGQLSVNDRSLITDETGAQLLLGTGGILTRYDTQVDKNGSSIINDKSIITSDFNIYWYDANSNEICRLGNGFTILSKNKLVLSDLNKLNRGNREQLIKLRYPISFFDKKYNEVWMKILDKPIVFNENLDVFTSYYTHPFTAVANNSKYVITFIDNELSHIHDEYNTYHQPYDRICKLCYIINQLYANTKVFDNVWFTGELNNNVILDIYFDDKTLLSEHLDLSNIENREDNYRFFIPRELSTEELNKKSMSYQGRMRGKYLQCNYTMNCNGDNEFKIPYINTTYRVSAL